ncbi:hypothetical protein MSG28_001353 [Choristoneura fumiferana]|uniref:Uncharacterized protein n=2 Tax=Choristoneura fumiferana TaxID=7141 RepID=A0ACC0KUC5_CHOFU|nr:hypothetical protein MSG28_001353 [Choristoneura fumiferana]
MVWIHGGGFRRWNSNRHSYGPKFLVRMGVILVTFNYRLGPYGSMSLNTTDIPGNAGLRDQLAALQWVKNNIAAFGGDDNNITLFGESAGAASVEFHLLSGYFEGLFHRAIMQSGTVLCDWVMKEPDLYSPLKLAGYMGFETDNVEEALRFISQLNAHDVIKATIGIGYGESFKPIVEHEFEGVRSMIKDKPSSLLKQANFSMPIIIGFNSKEQLRNIYNYLQSPEDYFERSNKTFKAKISDYFDLDDEELANAEKMVRHFYIGSEEIGEAIVDDMIEFDSDFTFVYPSIRSSRHYLQSSSAPVYLYMFDYAGARNYMKYRLNMTSTSGAMHADEIGYLFHQSYYDLPTTSMDNMIIYRMTTMWTGFAKTSNPTPQANELLPFTWHSSAGQAEPSYAVLNEFVRMQQLPYFRRMAFWDAFFALYENKTRW